MVAMNVGELNIPLSLSTREMRIQASQAKDILAGLDSAAAQLKKDLSFDDAMSNAKILPGVGIGESHDLKAIEDRRQVSDDIIKNVRQQQADAHRARIDEGAALRFQLLTEQEKHALRKQSDLEHLEALRRAGALTDAEMQKLSGQAGRLGLGNIAGDNNMKNRGFQGAMMAQQIGFGIQDFSSQITNSKNMVDGLGRGIMAVSNNMQMLGAAFGPTGLAVTAIGGAVAGIVLPAVIKWAYQSEDLEKSAKEIEKIYERIGRQADLIAKTRLEDPKDIVKKGEQLQKDAQAARDAVKGMAPGLDVLEQQKIAVEAQRKQDAQARKDRQLIGDASIQEDLARIDRKAKADQDHLDVQIAASRKEMDDRLKVAQGADAARKQLQPDIEKAQAKLKEEADQKRLDKNTKSDLAAAGKVFGQRLKDEMKSEEELQKFQQHGLEKFGKDREKLDSKHAKEQEELGDKLILHPNRDAALEALKAQQDVEVQKLLIDKEEDRLKKLGKPAEMSAGVDVASAEGIRAVNRAMTGFSSIDWEKQNLELMKKQTTFLEQIARDKTKVVALSG